MRLRFTIIDRTGTSHFIDEPVGWDGDEIEIKRDPDYHGIFFENNGSNLEFIGDALALLKTEYDLYGVEGDMKLMIEEECQGRWMELQTAKFVFAKYQYLCGSGCVVKVPVETIGEVMDLRNRINQKVNLESLKAFDEVTDLPAYDKLGFPIELPSKGLLLQNIAESTEAISENILASTETPLPVAEYGMIEFAMDNTKSAEIGGFNVNPTPFYTRVDHAGGSFSPGVFAVPGTSELIKINPLFASPIVNYAEEFPNYGQVSDVVDFSFRLDGTITPLNGAGINALALIIWKLPKDKVGDQASHYQQLHTDVFISGLGVYNLPFSFSSIYNNPSLVLEKGDRIYSFLTIYSRKVSPDSNALLDAFNIEFDSGNYWRMKTLSHMPPSESKVFMVNEAFSRVVESITNNKLKAYSEYFGRTDSQPYTHDADGCGSLEAITDGFRIRRAENRIPDKPALFTISLQDLFEGLSPIHNLGMGVEPDTNRRPFNRLRVEPWYHFYSDDIIMNCENVAKITRKVHDRSIFSTFTFGYQKWEAEEYTGLDEFLTKRVFRTTLNQVKNDFSRLSKMIGSGYALEITRRKDADSKDWRYDKETFIICLKRDDSDLVVELGNITSPENIIDPDTIYNFRISPIRNGMRWMNRILASYKQFNAGKKIIFTDGDGNYYAKGRMTSSSCRLEAAAIAENATLYSGVYTDPDVPRPFLGAERITFDYPMSVAEYQAIKANPYGVILFSGCEEGSGYIDTVTYKVYQGIASFTLIPKTD